MSFMLIMQTFVWSIKRIPAPRFMHIMQIKESVQASWGRWSPVGPTVGSLQASVEVGCCWCLRSVNLFALVMDGNFLDSPPCRASPTRWPPLPRWPPGPTPKGAASVGFVAACLIGTCWIGRVHLGRWRLSSGGQNARHHKRV